MSATTTMFLRVAQRRQQQHNTEEESALLLRSARAWLAVWRPGAGECGWTTRIELVAPGGGDVAAVVGEKRAHDGGGTGGARYVRCSLRHAEIDLTLLGPDPLTAWRQCYAHCVGLAGICNDSSSSSSSSSAAPFVLLLLHSDRIPPALGAVIHGFRTSAWHRPDRPIQFVFVGAFLPCAALQAGTEVVDLQLLQPGNTNEKEAATALDPAAVLDLRLQPLFKLLHGRSGAIMYPFNAVREELYRAQMFCVGLPEIIGGLVSAEGRSSVGAAVLADARCRAEIGDWVARNRHVYHAEQIIHSFHRSRRRGGLV